MSTHEPPAHPEQPTGAPPPPGEAAYVPPTLVDIMLCIEPLRDAVLEYCVPWQTGALLSTTKEMRDARGEFLRARTTLVGMRGTCHISAAGLLAYARWCPQLSKLHLFECKKTTDAGVIAVAQGCPQLSSLDLGGSRQYPLQITDAGVIALAQGCPQLSSLNLEGCDKITDKAVIAVVQGCPQLSSLNLRWCSKITEAAVIALAKWCPQLSSLKLDCCKQITDAGLRALAQGCPHLSSLVVDGCEQITEAAVTALLQGCPQLSNCPLWRIIKKTVGPYGLF